MELHLTPEQRRKVLSIFTTFGRIDTTRQRIDFLDDTTLSYHAPETVTKIPIDGSGEEFAKLVIREVELRGIITMTRQPALVLVLDYLRYLARGHAGEVAFLEELLEPYQPLSPLFEDPRQKRDVQILTNIWYSARQYGFFEGRDFDNGTLEIQHGAVTYQGERMSRFKIETILSVKHIRMGGSVNNNWVEVHYREGEREREAYFAEASRLGVGELIGGSHNLFLALRRLLH
jgi:hypothetical protein